MTLRDSLKALCIACGAALMAAPALAQSTPRIVAVNHPLQYFAERLAGGEAEVEFPVPATVDPSFWRPSISDISRIQSADLILLNGAGFATWVDRVSLPRSKVVNTSAALRDQFIVTESITHSHGDGGEHSHEGLASYLWLDPTLAIAQAEAVAAALSQRGLAPSATLDAELDALRSDLSALDAAAQAAFAGLDGTTFIATHPRYQYLARRYDLAISSLEWEAGAAPTDSEFEALAALAASSRATILIWEAMPPQSALDRVSTLGLRSVVLPSLAQPSGEQTFLEAFGAGIDALAALTASTN